MKWDFYIMNIISFFFEVYILNVAFNTIGRKSEHKWLIPLLSGIYVVLASIVFLFDHPRLISVLTLTIGAFIISWGYKENIKMRIVSVLIVIVLMDCAEYIVGFTMSLIFRTNVEEVTGTILYYTVGVLSSKLLALMIVKLFAHKYKKKDIQVNWKLTTTFLILPVITLTVGVTIIGASKDYNDRGIQLMGAIGEALLVFANLAVFYLFESYGTSLKKQYELESNEHQMKLEYEYLNEIITRQTISAKEMHDLKNQLYAIRDAIKNDDAKGLEMIDGICKTVNSAQEIKYTTNSAINALINSKKKLMDEKKIKLNCDINVLNFDFIASLDACALLGNLLDNAIEALDKEENKNVSIKMIEHCNYLSIQISNDSSNLNENLETTKKNKNAHGYGLKNVKEIVEKYQGNLQIKKTEGKFIVSIILKEDAS